MNLPCPDPSPAPKAAPYGNHPLNVAVIYSQNAQLLWKSLHRMGIPAADLPDVLQEVLLVVHRRLDSFDPQQSRLSTWLFGICLRVAATARRTRVRRREELMDDSSPHSNLVEATNPEQLALARDARLRLDRALDSLTSEKRAVFVMFELEEMSCGEIGELLGVPKGTVFSRLSSARQDFLQALGRIDAHEGRLKSSLGGDS